MNCFVFFLLLIVGSFGIANGMTRAQLKKTLTITKKQCMPKTHVTEAQVADIEKGTFLENHNVMCYITCVYRSLQVVKNNRLDKAAIMKTVDVMYPEEMRAPVKATIIQCIDVQNGYTDVCEGVFRSTKCLYEKDPPNFVFP